MLPWGLEFAVAVIVLVISIKFGILFGIGAYVAYRVLLKG